ncbi:hypothetical protein SGFS_031470 [Streptomyces graminofaciens]|uniref:Uncharacterized protein n=1 Tax=Streptomyces graminofaciens TaxID=68212 RepID=A0ABM7F7F2_9ACTN|nr:hypothetical protein [Streptomyces graminofaciens]BBC31853.1 hypothetical protein SGFS_031470 [Streptomyces graminofaciens]
MNSGSEEATGEEVIGAALRLLAARGEYGLPDVEQVESELPRYLEQFRTDPVTVDQLAARRGGLMTTGLVTTILTSSLVSAVVAHIIAEQVQVGARAATGKLSRWWNRRRGHRLASALRQPAQPFGAQDAEWLRGYVTAQCEGVGCPPEQAAAVADAVATAWVTRGRAVRPDRDGEGGAGREPGGDSGEPGGGTSGQGRGSGEPGGGTGVPGGGTGDPGGGTGDPDAPTQEGGRG